MTQDNIVSQDLTVTPDQYMQLLGLVAAVRELEKQEQALGEAWHRIFPKKDEYNDAFWELKTNEDPIEKALKNMLKAYKIRISPDKE